MYLTTEAKRPWND